MANMGKGSTSLMNTAAYQPVEELILLYSQIKNTHPQGDQKVSNLTIRNDSHVVDLKRNKLSEKKETKQFEEYKEKAMEDNCRKQTEDVMLIDPTILAGIEEVKGIRESSVCREKEIELIRRNT
ncbi:hypothetical protein ACH5RR_006895 [Cinchona calisaya]|uniref:Uncharacterized protein n=1 Tax=Cinchona calisaya TaxID=153742 RepID=A0ABD3AQR2_9GENT